MLRHAPDGTDAHVPALVGMPTSQSPGGLAIWPRKSPCDPSDGKLKPPQLFFPRGSVRIL